MGRVLQEFDMELLQFVYLMDGLYSVNALFI